MFSWLRDTEIHLPQSQNSLGLRPTRFRQSCRSGPLKARKPASPIVATAPLTSRWSGNIPSTGRDWSGNTAEPWAAGPETSPAHWQTLVRSRAKRDNHRRHGSKPPRAVVSTGPKTPSEHWPSWSGNIPEHCAGTGPKTHWSPASACWSGNSPRRAAGVQYRSRAKAAKHAKGSSPTSGWPLSPLGVLCGLGARQIWKSSPRPWSENSPDHCPTGPETFSQHWLPLVQKIREPPPPQSQNPPPPAPKATLPFILPPSSFRFTPSTLRSASKSAKSSAPVRPSGPV
jgi:hypothetical protein